MGNHSVNNEASIHLVTSGTGIQIYKQGEAEKDMNQRPQSHFSKHCVYQEHIYHLNTLQMVCLVAHSLTATCN